MNFKRFLGVVLGLFGIFYSYFYSYLKSENIIAFFTNILSSQYLFPHLTALVYLGYTLAAYFGRRYLMATLSGLVLFPLILNDILCKCSYVYGTIEQIFILSMLAFIYPLLFRKGWGNPKKDNNV